MSFLPIKNDKIYTLVMKQIRSLVENGELRSGDKLPSEKELTVLLGVSRASIRQAISALETMGVVESRRGFGTVVAEGVAPDSLADLFSHAIVPTQINPLDIIEARLMFECSVAGACAERRQKEHLDKMREAYAEMERCVRTASAPNVYDRQFHLAIAEGTTNSGVVKLMQSVNRMLNGNMWKLVRETNIFAPVRFQTYNAQHLEILTSIEERRAADAEQAMRRHLTTVRDDLEQDLSALGS